MSDIISYVYIQQSCARPFVPGLLAILEYIIGPYLYTAEALESTPLRRSGVPRPGQREVAVGWDEVGGVTLGSLSGWARGDSRPGTFGYALVALDADRDFIAGLRACVTLVNLVVGACLRILHRLASPTLRCRGGASDWLTTGWWRCSAAPTGSRLHRSTVSRELHFGVGGTGASNDQPVRRHATLCAAVSSGARRSRSAEHSWWTARSATASRSSTTSQWT